MAERAYSIEDQSGDGFAGEGAAQIRARTMGLIGELCRVLGDFVRAEISLKEALRIVATEFGEASEHVADARNNLAVLYKACGRFDEGLRLYQQALDSVVKLHGEKYLASSVMYHNIGGIYTLKVTSPQRSNLGEGLGRFLGDCLAKTIRGLCLTRSPMRRFSTASKGITKAKPHI
jgi:tetratricopeptide (TPR) repeat protein